MPLSLEATFLFGEKGELLTREREKILSNLLFCSTIVILEIRLDIEKNRLIIEILA